MGSHRAERDWPTTAAVLVLAALGTLVVRLWVVPNLF